jgi:HlyD family secretion protein
MLRKYGLPILAIAGLVAALAAVIITSRVQPPPPVLYPPPKSPYIDYVAGSGIVEAASENISIGSPFVALVTDVYVCAGAIVNEGDPLFKLDTRVLEAQLQEAKAAREVFAANFKQLVAQPRVETVPPQEALVRAAKAEWENQKTQLKYYQRVTDIKAISLSQLTEAIYAEKIAKAQFDQAEANLFLLNAGAWVMDLAIVAQQIAEADAQIGVVQKNIDISTITAPLDGQVLQVRVHVGEIADQLRVNDPSDTQHPMMLFGVIDPYHIRVDIDEEDLWKVVLGAPGVAFVRFEPYVVPKLTLTGNTAERVDTRVFQLIYRFDPKNLPIYMGQVMDVYIDASSNP